jgi:hypothetical protein
MMKSMFTFLLSINLISSTIFFTVLYFYLGKMGYEYLTGLLLVSLLCGGCSVLAVYLVLWIENIVNGLRKHGSGYFVERKN